MPIFLRPERRLLQTLASSRWPLLFSLLALAAAAVIGVASFFFLSPQQLRVSQPHLHQEDLRGQRDREHEAYHDLVESFRADIDDLKTGQAQLEAVVQRLSAEIKRQQQDPSLPAPSENQP
jgi:hypothetical protein